MSAQKFINQSIPSVPADTPPALKKFLESLKNTIEVREGRAGELYRSITLDDLHKSGVVDLIVNGVRISSDGSSASGFISSSYNNLTVPPAVTTLATLGGFEKVFLTWDDTDDRLVSHVQVWRASVDDFSQAVLIGTSSVSIYQDVNVGNGESWYYWVRAISLRGIAGPLNDVSGTLGQPSYDPSYVLSVLSGQITESELYSGLNARIDNIDAPGTGLLSRVTVAESDIASSASQIVTLSATSDSHATSIANNAAAITANAAAVTTNTQAITSLDSDVGVLASQMITVQTQVDGNEAAVQTNLSSINGLNAQYTVKTDVNGHIAGIGLASTVNGEGLASSEIIVQADRFGLVFPAPAWSATSAFAANQFVKPTLASVYVYKATVPGTTGATEPVWPITPGATVVDGTVTWECLNQYELVPFAVGTVAGQTVVGINGNLLIDGSITAASVAANTITADKINVANLAAISADLGAITGGSLDINGKFLVSETGLVTIKSAATGARMEMANNVIKVYDTAGILRVKIGDLSA